MSNSKCRTYGGGPIRAVVVHGEPGAGGEMAPVARSRLSEKFGVLEPIQTACSVDGQVAELHKQIAKHAVPPIVLIGYSWGAWLSVLTVAAYPDDIAKIILISSGPFETVYAEQIEHRRLARLGDAERAELSTLLVALESSSPIGNGAMARLGHLIYLADNFDLDESLTPEDGGAAVEPDSRIYASVWPEAAQMRRDGRLISAAGQLHCPVTAIHGSADPHPAEGVREPLSRVVVDFRFILLERCGNTPWIEKRAREPFFQALVHETASVLG